jgi:hypothetical protein
MKITLAMLGAAVVLSGCASIMNEKTQAINVTTSNGKQISGKVNGADFTAPGVVQVVRENKSKVFSTEADGCVKETVAEKNVDSKFFVNIISGGGLGSTTDYATEKMWAYAPTVTINCK